MRKKLLSVIGLVAIFSSSVAFATEQVSARTVTRILVYGTSIVMELSAPVANRDGCTRADRKFVRMPISGATGRAMYASVLSAKASGARLGFGINGCSTWGGSTIPVVYRVDMY